MMLKKRNFGLLIGMILWLAGCQLPGLNSAEPPPPTIVSQRAAEPTPTTSDDDSPAVPTAPTPARPALDAVEIELVSVAEGFTRPLYVTHAGDDRLFVVEQPGRIFILSGEEKLSPPFLDIVSLVGSSGNEQGLLSVAFHPNYAENGYFYVDYTDKQGDTVIARYRVSDNPDVADPNSATVLLRIAQPYANHNGGLLLFGPDGYLYAGLGDGGAAGDPQNNAQDLGVLLGKILRLDVDQGRPYGVPESNPFVDRAEARPEIWSYGWRNPWRFSFDTMTGDMYIGDVGQNAYEEIDVEPAEAPGGLNYGWRLMEGKHCFRPSDCDPASLDVVLPVVEYGRQQGISVTGGYVYRGASFPALNGIYFYADYGSGKIWGLRQEPDASWSQAELLQTDYNISSFGLDRSGELYLTALAQGRLFQVQLR